MNVAGLTAESLSTPFGTRLQLSFSAERKPDGVLEAIERLDRREVEQLRDICNAFLDGEPVR